MRDLVGLLGELLLTAGVFLLLFVAWQLWWTDVVADADAAEVVTAMEVAFSEPDTVQPEGPEFGKAFALVRIPRFGEKYVRPLYSGTTRQVLMRGIGHYSDTALPGEIGNFSMAGHRTTYGKPFTLIADLEPDDVILIETKDTYFVYRMISNQIVRPSQSEVVAPVPNEPGAEPTEALLTMTSCHPQFSSRQRFIVHAKLDATYPRADGVPADLLRVR